ncbi:MAG: Bro-N domain-containing protein [Deltaproteobacteria bacterium]|jgi:prophage antirepressor-like protein|nr:Bro-N domain-containing protein [Deltaproteobacteria bacterium]
MANSNVPALVVFDNDVDLNYVEKNGEILFTAEEIGKHLGYSNPGEAVGRLFRRNRNELKLYAVPVKLTGTDGKQYETRLFAEEGAYLLSMLARTSEAKKFRARVALLLRRLRQEALRRELEQVRHDAAARALALTPSVRLQIQKILAYQRRGFSWREICKVMDLHNRTLGGLLKTARELGLAVKRTPAIGKGA